MLFTQKFLLKIILTYTFTGGSSSSVSGEQIIWYVFPSDFSGTSLVSAVNLAGGAELISLIRSISSAITLRLISCSFRLSGQLQ